MLSGIDASNHQGAIDWPAVEASGRAFAIVKATEGVDFADPFFARNWAGLRATGMIRGAYHFARPSRNQAREEAAYLFSVISAVGGLLPSDLVALDLEDPDVPEGADLLAWTLEWLESTERLFGFPPLIYSNASYLSDHHLLVPELARFPLWLAAWSALRPHPPGDWQEIAVWQFTDTETIPGVNGPSDGDQADSIEVLRAIGKHAPDDATRAVHVVIPDMKRVGKLLGTAWGIADKLDPLESPYAPQLRDVVVGLKEELGLQPKARH